MQRSSLRTFDTNRMLAVVSLAYIDITTNRDCLFTDVNSQL